MYRKYRWSSDIILFVWQKAKIISGYNASIFRKDACGAWIQFDKHGDRKTKYGWEIDHILPVVHGGTDALSNLQPLYWENNIEKGDSSQLKCAVKN